ncbi:putative multicopper oxidase [Rostrohypoxylon terebratum]|nr:putative multicopper oxidase [Rostrohypoxylon terebratum]
MFGRRSSSSGSAIRSSGPEVVDCENSPMLDWPAKGWENDRFIDVPLGDERRGARRAVSLRVFVLSAVCLFVVALALGTGCGFGIGVVRYKTLEVKPSIGEGYVGKYGPGVPEDLEFVLIDRLVNRTELDLDTGFLSISAEGQQGGQIREYEFDVALSLAAPDGFRKPMVLVNGQSPGPLIEANVGDTIKVHVNNLMANVSTSIHWHGINQQGTPWMDGVAGITQCGIPPGKNFTYEFKVEDQRGTFWWHAHTSVQFTDGAYGAIVIRDTSEMVPETDDEKLIFVSDVYHTFGSVLPQANLQMGARHVRRRAPRRQRPDERTEHIQLRLINASSFFSYWFSIDNHTLTIVELDGVEIEPVSARGVYLNLGQRVSVILSADQEVGRYYVRATIPKTCFMPYSTYVSAGLEEGGYGVRGVLEYVEEGSERVVDVGDGDGVGERVLEMIGVAGNTSNPHGVENNGLRGDVWEGCDDMPFDMPVPMRRQPAVNVSEENTHYIEYAFRQAQEVNRIFINKTSYTPLPHNATLWKAVEQEFTADKENSYNSWDFGLNQQVLHIPDASHGAQIVINSKDGMEHPWHLHGHTFQIVGWGHGPFGSDTTTWNLDNPLRRDTVTVPANNHVVIRFATDNPGVWALHCHVAWHVEGGMFLTLAERPSDLVRMINDMNMATRRQSQSFCAAGDGTK